MVSGSTIANRWCFGRVGRASADQSNEQKRCDQFVQSDYIGAKREVYQAFIHKRMPLIYTATSILDPMLAKIFHWRVDGVPLSAKFRITGMSNPPNI